MNNNQINGIIAFNTGLVAIIVLLFLFSGGRSKWEYQTLEFIPENSDTAFSDNQKALSYKTIPDITPKIVEMGQQRWELVSSYLEHETAHPNFGNSEYVTGIQPNIRPQKLVLIFKRRQGFF